MNSPSLLTAYEKCPRLAYWSRDWQRAKIDLTELLQEGIKEGVRTSREDYGNASGEKVMEISAQREIVQDKYSVYDACIHTASLADVVSSAIRKAKEPPWLLPDPIGLGNGPTWHSGAFLSPSGESLRRIVLASNWSTERHYSEARSLFSLGEVAAYGLPMQQAVIVLGQSRDGKRHGYFSKGVQHPANKRLRFRKRNSPGESFKSSWITIFREDHDEISTHDWLQEMHQDGVLADSCFSVTIEVPERAARQRIVDVMARKLDTLYNLEKIPDEQYTGCFWPTRCQYVNNCHSEVEPSGRFGFVRTDQLA